MVAGGGEAGARRREGGPGSSRALPAPRAHASPRRPPPRLPQRGRAGGGAARWPAVLRIIHGMQMGLPNYRDTHVQVGPRVCARVCARVWLAVVAGGGGGDKGGQAAAGWRPACASRLRSAARLRRQRALGSLGACPPLLVCAAQLCCPLPLPGCPGCPGCPAQTVAVSVAAKDGRLEDALAVYRLMLQDGVQPKAPTFNACEAAVVWAGRSVRGMRCATLRRMRDMHGSWRLWPGGPWPTRLPHLSLQ